MDKITSSQTSQRILFILKTKGSFSSAELAESLRLTPEAARQQVQKLLGSGLIEGRQKPSARAGRPRQVWTLTETGHARFPDTHAQLTVQMISAVRELFGSEGMDRLISRREEETKALYSRVCNGPGLEERLRQLTGIRSQEGYMARLESEGEDWILTEDHCPICAAATACQGFCRSELDVFQSIVAGDGTVVREQHLLSGARQCVYRITPKG